MTPADVPSLARHFNDEQLRTLAVIYAGSKDWRDVERRFANYFKTIGSTVQPAYASMVIQHWITTKRKD